MRTAAGQAAVGRPLSGSKAAAGGEVLERPVRRRAPADRARRRPPGARAAKASVCSSGGDRVAERAGAPGHQRPAVACGADRAGCAAGGERGHGPEARRLAARSRCAPGTAAFGTRPPHAGPDGRGRPVGRHRQPDPAGRARDRAHPDRAPRRRRIARPARAALRGPRADAASPPRRPGSPTRASCRPLGTAAACRSMTSLRGPTRCWRPNGRPGPGRSRAASERPHPGPHAARGAVGDEELAAAPVGERDRLGVPGREQEARRACASAEAPAGARHRDPEAIALLDEAAGSGPPSPARTTRPRPPRSPRRRAPARRPRSSPGTRPRGACARAAGPRSCRSSRASRIRVVLVSVFTRGRTRSTTVRLRPNTSASACSPAGSRPRSSTCPSGKSAARRVTAVAERRRREVWTDRSSSAARRRPRRSRSPRCDLATPVR